MPRRTTSKTGTGIRFGIPETAPVLVLRNLSLFVLILAASIARADAPDDPYVWRTPPRAPAASGPILKSIGGSNVGIQNSKHVPSDTAAADFNGDGIQDLAIAYAFDDAIDWYFGRPDGQYDFGGSLGAGTHPAAVANDLPRKLAVADFDQDGFLDIAAICSGATLAQQTAPSLGIFYGLPGGGFEPFRTVPLAPAATPSPRFSVALAVGLVDDDDQPDLVVGHMDSHQISVLLHDSGRQWKTPLLLGSNVSAAGNTGPVDLKLVDLDLDGRTDVVAVNFKTVQIWRGNGNGTFESPHTLANLPDPSAVGFTAAGLADFDRDGRWDLALLDASADLMRLYMGLSVQGTYQLATTVPLPAGSAAIDLAIDDVDLDGRPDAAVAYLNGASGQWFMGQPSGAEHPLVAGRSFPTGAGPRSIHAWRANADPFPDLATANEGDSNNAANEDITLDLGQNPARRRSYFQALSPSNATIAPNALAAAGLSRPVGLAFDAATQSLWTFDRRRRQFVRMDRDGNILARFEASQRAGGSLIDPVDLACDGAGGLWIADRGAAKMVHLDADGNLLSAFPTNIADGVTRPAAAAFDPQEGKLYIADDLTLALVVFDPAGAVLETWSLADIGALRSLGWDAHEGRLWGVLERSTDAVAVLELNDSDPGDFSPEKIEIARNVDLSGSPSALAAGSIRSLEPDGDDDCFWALTDSGALLRLDMEDCDVEQTSELSLFRSVAAAAIEPAGTLLIADGGALGSIVRLSASGDALTSFSLARPLGRPVRLAGLARSEDAIFALDALNCEIAVLSPSGQLLGRLAANTLRGRRPEGLAWNAAANALLVGVPGAVLELPLEGGGPSSAPHLTSGIQSHPIPADRSAGSLSHGTGAGSMGVFSPGSGALTLFDAQWSPVETIAEKRGFPATSAPLGALPLNATGSLWLFYGSADAPLTKAALIRPSTAADPVWGLYK